MDDEYMDIECEACDECAGYGAYASGEPYNTVNTNLCKKCLGTGKSSEENLAEYET